MTTPQLIIFLALLLFIALVALKKHILGPWMLKRAHVTPRVSVYDEISDEQAQILLPPMFFETVVELNAIGFALVSHLVNTNSLRTRMVVSLFVNHEAKTIALVGRIAVRRPVVQRVPVGFIEFNTNLRDGREISTINTSTVHVFYDAPERVVNRVPHLKDAASLFQVHRYVVAQAGSPAVLPEAGTEIDAFREQMIRTNARQAELGYHYLDETGENYRLTWRAAFRSAWRLLWPAKQILQRRQERAGRRLAAVSGD